VLDMDIACVRIAKKIVKRIANRAAKRIVRRIANRAAKRIVRRIAKRATKSLNHSLIWESKHGVASKEEEGTDDERFSEKAKGRLAQEWNPRSIN